MTAPSVDEAPPGFYMVFLVNDQGVPSIAPVVRLDASPDALPQPRVTQSSQFDRTTPAWNAFDGAITQEPGSKLSRTLSEPQPWWQVDLGESRNLEGVTVRFRTDCCSVENRDLWVFASDVPFGSTTVAGLQAQPGVSAVRLQTPTGNVNVAALNRSARYIRVQSPATGSLALTEVTPNAATTPNQAPAISISSPANGTRFVAPANFTLETTSSDSDGTVAKVDFYRGGVLHETDTSAPFSAGVSGLQAGSHTFTAKATDDDGAETTSDPVSVTVDPASSNQPPAVSITSPANGARYNAPASFRVDATSSDPDGTVAKVQFFRGSTLLKADSTVPYTAPVSGPRGRHAYVHGEGDRR